MNQITAMNTSLITKRDTEINNKSPLNETKSPIKDAGEPLAKEVEITSHQYTGETPPVTSRIIESSNSTECQIDSDFKAFISENKEIFFKKQNEAQTLLDSAFDRNKPYAEKVFKAFSGLHEEFVSINSSLESREGLEADIHSTLINIIFILKDLGGSYRKISDKLEGKKIDGEYVIKKEIIGNDTVIYYKRKSPEKLFVFNNFSILVSCLKQCLNYICVDIIKSKEHLQFIGKAYLFTNQIPKAIGLFEKLLSSIDENSNDSESIIVKILEYLEYTMKKKKPEDAAFKEFYDKVINIYNTRFKTKSISSDEEI